MRQAIATIVLAWATAHADGARAGCDSLEELAWLLGEWIAQGNQSTFHESWSRTGRQTFEGAGVERSHPDGRIKGSEDLRLAQMGGELFYVSKVSHNDLPIAFRLTTCDAGRFVFENAAHDFPRRLEYRSEADDRLQVEVSDGAGKGFTLDFARAPEAADPAAAVLRAEDARFAAMIAADAVAMRRWFADDLQYTHSTGRVETRDQLVASIATGQIRYLAVTPSGRSVKSIGSDTALVHGHARLRAAKGDAVREFDTRYLAVYRLEAGDWKLEAWQSTGLAPEWASKPANE